MNYAIILAGGRGARMGNTDVPKQFIELTGVPMVVYSMRTAQMNENIDEICVVAPVSSYDQIRRCAKEYNITKFKMLSEAVAELYLSVYS